MPPEVPAPRGPYRPAPPAPPPGHSTLAVLAAALLVVCAPASVVLGVLARRRIARTGERGRGLATTAVAAGAALTALGAVVVALVVSSGAVAVDIGTVPSASTAPAPAVPEGPTVPASAVASSMEQEGDGRLTDVSCRDDLPARVGASVACSARVDGRPGMLSATVTSVDADDTVRFDIEQVAAT